MGPSFIACDRERSFLMPPDVREWLPEDHFAWFVLDAVEAMDLELFYVACRGDGRTRPAYEPAMMVAVILYAYARGVRSARAIERACIEDIAFRVLAAQTQPDHATLARFVERWPASRSLAGSVTGRPERRLSTTWARRADRPWRRLGAAPTGSSVSPRRRSAPLGQSGVRLLSR